MKSEFNVTSGKMVCSDPSYSIPTWCQGVIDNVRNGKWEAQVCKTYQKDWGERISYLWVYNLEAVIKNPSIKKDIEVFRGYLFPYDFGVDSGQFGFFDFASYRNDESAKDLNKHDFGDGWDAEVGDEWYRACAGLTLTESWGVLPNGVVSSSGFGDGSYDVRGIKYKGKWVAFCVEFIPNDGYDYEDGDNENDNNENDNNENYLNLNLNLNQPTKQQ